MSSKSISKALVGLACAWHASLRNGLDQWLELFDRSALFRPFPSEQVMFSVHVLETLTLAKSFLNTLLLGCDNMTVWYLDK